MRILRFFMPLLCMMVLFSCKWNAVRVSKFEPGKEVPLKSTLTFEFNKDLAPSDKEDEWLTDEFVTFQPKIPGKFKWTSMRTLIFSPEGPLAPSQDYVAKVTDKVLFGNKKQSTSFDDIDFHTPYFQVSKLDFYWTQIPKSDYKVSVQANIKFNYPVVPAQLANYIEVTRGSEPVKNFNIVTQEASDVVTVNFGEAKQDYKAQDFNITIKKGFNSIYKKKPLAEDKEFKVSLAPITELTIQYVTSGYDGDQGWIEVGTSQMVDKDYLEKYVELSPSPKVNFVVNPSSFRIEGPFKAGELVSLKITDGLPGLYGGTLRSDYDGNVSIANMDPSISFDDREGKYMMLSGYKNLKVNATNIPEAEVEVYQVFQNNLLHFLHNTDYYNYRNEGEDDDVSAEAVDEEEGDYGDDESYYGDDQYGKFLYKEKVKLAGHENLTESFNVNLKKALGLQYKGIYVVKVRSSTDRWQNDVKYIAMTDLAMICKRSENDLLVWVNSIASTDPVSGIPVRIISTNNQTIMEAQTDGNGMATFTNIKESFNGFKPRLIIAEKGQDFNYLDLSETNIETSRFDVGGKEESKSGYDAFIYAERNLYRPGEDMHLSAIVRSSDMNVVKDVPFVIKMIAPNGKSIQEWKKNTNEEGSFEWSFNIPQYAQTGEYIAEIYSGSNQLVSSYRYGVEEFAPDKIRVDLKPGNKSLRPGDVLALDVKSSYLFGAPSAGSKYETDIYFSNISYSSKKLPDYDFSNYSTQNTDENNFVKEGELDDKGQASISYVVPATMRSGGIIKANAVVSVFDVTGRSVSRGETFSIYPNNYYIGIKSDGDYFSSGQSINVKLAAVDKNDNLQKGFPVRVELIHYEWNNVLVKNWNDRYTYTSQKKEILQWQKDFVLNGVMSLPIRTEADGEYELRVHRAGDSDYVRQTFYNYGYGSNNASDLSVDKEGNVDIKPDKTSYAPGEKAKLLFSTPFSGRMLVTVERNKVFYNEYVDVKGNSAEVQLPIGDDYMPNVYVSATLFKKHTFNASSPMLVAHGWQSIKIEKPSNKIAVQILAPKKIKPRTTQTITVKTIPQKDVFVTLAAVDEGVLQIKGYKTPDPYKYMYDKRQLTTKSYDMYKLLLPEVAGSPSTGGDEAFEMNKKRSIPLIAQRFKLLTYWSGIRRSDASGNVKISLPIPQFNGEVRLMAVAYTGQKFGSAEQFMEVSDDVILLPSVPRFLSQNDDLSMPVTVMNTTNRAGTVTVKMNLSGPLNATSTLTQTINLKPKEEHELDFSLKTDNRVGVGKISFVATGMANTQEDIELAVRPVSPFVQESGSGIIKAGQSFNIQVPGDYLNGTQKATLTVARFPALQHAKYLKALLGYPYGCVEQTVARAFPQLYFDELAQAVAPEMYKKSNPVYYVNEAIRKVQSMQLYDGSISYWPGGDYSNWWGSVFAAHFLVEAKKMGYEVNQGKLDKLLNYLHTEATKKSVYKYSTYTGNNITVHKIANKEIIYSLYVLALANRTDQSLMNYYRARPSLLSGDMQYMLAGAYALAGNWSMYNAMLPKSFTPEQALRTTGDDFDSEIRSNAIMLDVLLEVDPGNNQIPFLTKYLLRNQDKIYSTEDLVWAYMALGKAAKANASAKVTVKLSNGSNVLGTYADKTMTISNSTLNGKTVTFSATGSGQVYYFWNTEGVKVSKPVKVEDANLRIRRTYYDRFGKQINGNTFNQGDLVVCCITLQGTGKSVDNVAVTDMVPAGFEIMNPRTTSLNNLNWMKNVTQSTPQYLDIRDDRLLYFTNVPAKGAQQFYYMMRAINTGEFQLPAIGAEAMYDPEYHSYHGATKVRIVKGKESI